MFIFSFAAALHHSLPLRHYRSCIPMRFRVVSEHPAVVYRASPRDLGLKSRARQGDSAFYHFNGLINKHQACLGTEHWRFRVRLTT
ncbi:hypothetical protein TNCV_1965911 [Trichonephila clavipes]|nr:hypothetical protein TNCV_1965911 [Trichonephila clavipes]